MIDLLKTYKELKNAPGYVGSLRYYIAKKKIDVKWELDRLCLWNGWAHISKSSKNCYKRLRKGSLKPRSNLSITKITQPSLFSP